jgi:hypothetical protein
VTERERERKRGRERERERERRGRGIEWFEITEEKLKKTEWIESKNEERGPFRPQSHQRGDILRRDYIGHRNSTEQDSIQEDPPNSPDGWGLSRPEVKIEKRDERGGKGGSVKSPTHLLEATVLHKKLFHSLLHFNLSLERKKATGKRRDNEARSGESERERVRERESIRDGQGDCRIPRDGLNGGFPQTPKRLQRL